jgi:phosphoserine phosphatase
MATANGGEGTGRWREHAWRARERGWWARRRRRSSLALLHPHRNHHHLCLSLSLSPVKRTPSPAVLATWRSARAVCFDVDSTLCEDESIDELAAFLGKGEAVAALTAAAMGGDTKFEDALEARLGLMQPSASDVEAFLAAHPPRLSPGIPDLVRRLQARGTQVFLVSGGFRAIINPIADLLDIPRSHVHANTILFDAETGAYAGFDRTEHTSRSGGKRAAVRAIRASDPGLHPVVAIGDGVTDAEAVAPDGADAFIGYGGVVERPAVAARADWFVNDIQTLIDALGEEEDGGVVNGA